MKDPSGLLAPAGGDISSEVKNEHPNRIANPNWPLFIGVQHTKYEHNKETVQGMP